VLSVQPRFPVLVFAEAPCFLSIERLREIVRSYQAGKKDFLHVLAQALATFVLEKDQAHGEADQDHDRNGFNPGSSRSQFAVGMVLGVWL
jgi:hypothetical protein